MGSQSKEIASKFFTAFALGNAEEAITFLDPEVEFVNGEDVVKGIREVRRLIDPPRDNETIELGKRELKEVEGTLILSTTFTGTIPSDEYGPSQEGYVSLRLTFRGDKILRIETNI
jgi:hypothetical protein